MGLRERLISGSNGTTGLIFFRVFKRYPNEIVLGEDDTHLNFRVSVLLQPPSQGRPRRLIVTTLVFYNRLLGHAYIALIAPFPSHGCAWLASSSTEDRMAYLITAPPSVGCLRTCGEHCTLFDCLSSTRQSG
ncbi:MAG: DUF2867 domain-containing protein [Paraburkholderia tropica]